MLTQNLEHYPYPFYILSLISITTILFLSILISKSYSHVPCYNIIIIVAIGISLWFGFLAFIYRTSLLDTHERFSLLFIKDLSKTIYLRLVDNFEYIIYRAKLATYETNRQKIELDNLIKILIFIEDKEYFKHRGISIKGISRSILSLLNKKPRSGGSTITQQIARTLFIQDLYKTIRRKIIEICLALWLNNIISKKDLLEIYLSSVRFEKGIFGVADAMNYFFGTHIKSPSIAQSFFLIERVSNIRSKLLYQKIVATIKSAKNNGLLTYTDIVELVQIYEKAIDEQKIIDQKNGLWYLKRTLLELK